MRKAYYYIYDIEIPEETTEQKLIEYQKEQIQKLLKRNRELSELVTELREQIQEYENNEKRGF